MAITFENEKSYLMINIGQQKKLIVFAGSLNYRWKRK